MAQLETIIRPFQTGDVTPPTIVIAAGAVQSNMPIRIRPGLVGSTKTLRGSRRTNVTYYVVQRPKEKQAEE